MNSQKIGERLTKIRLEKKETQKDVADALGTSVSTIANYENGYRIPKDDYKIKLAEHFNCTVASLFFCD
jgi:transcriptional regulator with XRE-family HTH domain